ncbi:MAG: hypothetical protein R3C20_20240 [Planctomycetaceae bacterium]
MLCDFGDIAKVRDQNSAESAGESIRPVAHVQDAHDSLHDFNHGWLLT